MQSPFGSADALVFCWLAFFNYPEYLGETEMILKEITTRGLLSDELMYKAAYWPRKSKKFFERLTRCGRFDNIRLSRFTEVRSDNPSQQFAALCIKFGENKYFVAFRGTDPSFLGWYESFSLACRYPVPSQSKAAEYLENCMRGHENAEFYVGGISKGGNVAVYAAACMDNELQSRIKKVYDFDGPGFAYGLKELHGFESISDKVVKIVPKSSFVGMLFNDGMNYLITDSSAISLLQHNPFSWKIKGQDFCYRKKRTRFSARLEKAVNDWINSIGEQEREKFIIIVRNALDTLDTDDFNVFFKSLHRQIPALYRQYKKLGEEDRKFFAESLGQLVKRMLRGKKALSAETDSGKKQ